MRVMVIVKANTDSEAGVMPNQQLMTDMGKFNEELVNAGILLDGEGLYPSSQGARVHFKGDSATVIYGPFGETKELIGGFWIWKVNSWQEAIEWAQRHPKPHEGPDECLIELRPIFEMEDFGAEFTPEVREAEEQLRARVEAAAAG